MAVLVEHVDPVARMQGAHRFLDLAGPEIGEVPHFLSVALPVHRGELGPARPLRMRAGLTTAGRSMSLRQCGSSDDAASAGGAGYRRPGRLWLSATRQRRRQRTSVAKGRRQVDGVCPGWLQPGARAGISPTLVRSRATQMAGVALAAAGTDGLSIGDMQREYQGPPTATAL